MKYGRLIWIKVPVNRKWLWERRILNRKARLHYKSLCKSDGRLAAFVGLP